MNKEINEVHDVNLFNDFGLTSTSIDVKATLAGNEIPLVLGNELFKSGL